MSKDRLKEKIKELPQSPGVYIMKSQSSKIIYVGKAKNLRNRVRSYFSQSDLPLKTVYLVKNIHDFEYVLTKTEVEAFLLEAALIKKHRPKYNIRLKDDKAYPYICLSKQDEFPRLYLKRKVEKTGALYFGPFTSGLAVHSTIKFLNRSFLIRDCTDAVMSSRKRPCMTYQIGRCSAPCVGYIDQKKYAEDVESVRSFLAGRNRKLLISLEKKMKQAADEEKFETAAKLRDSIVSIKKILEKQSVVVPMSELDQDVLSYYSSDLGTVVEMLFIRGGVLIGNRKQFLKDVCLPENMSQIKKDDFDNVQEDPREFLVSFINQYYYDNIIPNEVILPIDLGLDLVKLLSAVLEERSSHKVKIVFASSDQNQKLIEMANKNALAHYDSIVSQNRKRDEALIEIQEKFNLKNIPKRIECFDISNFQGSETVASQVVYIDGQSSKDDYRRYKLNQDGQPNDFASMREVLSRRLKRTDWDLPDLIVVDGGKGQLSQAVEILKELQKNIPVVGLAKARTLGEFHEEDLKSTEERFYLPGRSNPVVFKSNSEAFKILVSLRDEAHRFAIQYHRKLRGKEMLSSELDQIPGLGEVRKKALLKAFESVDEIRHAELDELIKIDGINTKLAQEIVQALNAEKTKES